ncbi:linker for activation of T-cells family member 2 isoform 2-T2 [Sylvia borin]
MSPEPGVSPQLTGCPRRVFQAMVPPELCAAAALMLLGAAVSLCIRCQHSATERETQLSQRRSQLESQQRFAVIQPRTTTRRLEQIKEPENLPIARKAIEELSASHHTGYENCLQESAYVEPISLGLYYNCTRIFNPPQGRSQEKDEDSYSYENVIIGASQGSDPGSDPDDAVDYENSMAIHTWKLQHRQATASLTESLDDEPDYINTGPVSGPALLSQQRILHEV